MLTMRCLLLLLAACAPTMPEPFAPSPGRVLTSILPNEERGTARRVEILTESCRSAFGNPIVLGPNTEPREGTQVVVSWAIETVRPKYAEGDEAPAIALLVSDRPMEPILVGSAAPGCYLAVNPDHVFAPNGDWFVYDQQKQLATLRWTPMAGSAGSDLFLQLIVVRPTANTLGMIGSVGLQLHVGAAFP